MSHDYHVFGGEIRAILDLLNPVALLQSFKAYVVHKHLCGQKSNEVFDRVAVSAVWE